MPVKVIDAAVRATLLFGEPGAEAFAGRPGAARLVAPALLGFELANVCLIKSRRHPEKRALLTAGFKLRDQLALEGVAVEHGAVLELATATGLTTYDASCVWLARQLRAELVTLDCQLAKVEAALPPK